MEGIQPKNKKNKKNRKSTSAFNPRACFLFILKVFLFKLN